MGLTLYDTRALVAWLVVSVAVHVALVLILPGMRAVDRSPPEILEVRLEQPQPPRILPPLPEPVTPSPAPRSKRVPKKELRRPPPVVAPAPRETPVTAPETPAAPPPVLTAPQSEAAVRSAPAEAEIAPRQDAPRQEAPRAAQAPQKSDAAPREPGAATTPPTFSAAYLRNPPPRYPVIARRNGEEGTVTLRVFVTREGAPTNVTVQTTSGSASLDQAAVEAVRGWRFVPARHGADSVDAWVLVPIVFRLDGRS